MGGLGGGVGGGWVKWVSRCAHLCRQCLCLELLGGFLHGGRGLAALTLQPALSALSLAAGLEERYGKKGEGR